MGYSSQGLNLAFLRERRPGNSLGDIRARALLALARRRSPKFLVQGEAGAGWWSCLKAISKPAPATSSAGQEFVFRMSQIVRSEAAGRSLGASLLLHCSLILLLVNLPQSSPVSASELEAPESPVKIYYRVPKSDPVKALPHIAPKDRGARPGSGFTATKAPVLGSTSTRSTFVIVSRPPKPDNYRQTIIQPNSPPDLRINTEVKVPNLVVGNPFDIPKPKMEFHPDEVHPTQVKRQLQPDQAPNVVGQAPTLPKDLSTLLAAKNEQPKLPLAPAAAPIAKRANDNGQPAQPSDVVPGAPRDLSGLLALGVDPAAPTEQVVLPPGNRYGEFSVSPAGTHPGSPGGAETGSVAGGSMGSGANAGDASTGVGTGGTGGGGNTGIGTVSIRGGASEVSGSLDPTFIASLVYPIANAMLPRKNAFVVSAGPIGGGGLSVYGALSCGKIYTVFVQMPGKNWALQYCQMAGSDAKPTQSSTTAVIHLEPGILPPEAQTRFDFRRLPVPAEKAHKMIVLKGVIREDGAVDHLQVYQGVQPVMDQAALAALSRWKFKPAMRSGKALAVQILVGIPPVEPAPAQGDQSPR